MTERSIWQQAAGDTDRHYVDTCLRWGVILNGPGAAGQWPDCQAPLLARDVSQKKLSDLRRFSVEMQEGDLVVLRTGTATVHAVGEICGPYEWHPEFGDIDGWDLQHVRRVRWLWAGSEGPKAFDTYALKLGDTTQRLTAGPVLEWLDGLDLSAARGAALPALPSVSASISPEKISEFLFDRGVASSSINALMGEMGELIRIAGWYKRAGGDPSEHETVAYLVVPLLRALGWTPQRMAVEWNRVDVALFESLPREDATLRVVVEAKKMGNSCLSALSQAEDYSVGKRSCHRLIVTDGLRYGVYVRRADEPFWLYAYMNLTDLRSGYPVYGCEGAEEALLAMTPEWSLARTTV